MSRREGPSRRDGHRDDRRSPERSRDGRYRHEGRRGGRKRSRDHSTRDYRDDGDHRRDDRRRDRHRSPDRSTGYWKGDSRDSSRSSQRSPTRKEKRQRSNESDTPPANPSTNVPRPASVIEPLSIEEVLRKHKEEEEAAAKPKFMSRAQREKLAMERRAAQVAEQQAKRKELEVAHDRFLDRVKRVSRGERDDWRRGDGRRRDDRPHHDSHHRSREPRQEPRGRGDASSSAGDGQSQSDGVMDGKMLEQIRSSYMGKVKRKRRVTKPGDKGKVKFVFEWDASDDTTGQDYNPLYANRARGQLAFGRGFVAGIDQREQLEEMKKYRKVAPKLEKRLENYLGRSDSGLHWSDKKLEDMTARDWRIFKEDFNIASRGGSIPHPIRSWSESGLPGTLMKAIEEAGYEQPSPIQRQAIPIGLQNRDILGVAETGSGKTAAFVLPMLVYISRLPPLTPETEADGPLALIMAPTRELVQQIEAETIKFAKHMGLRTVSVVGGQSIEQQAFLLRRGCEIVIATPGRLNDCLESRYVVLNQCNYVVLDEADRMMDMGFEPQVTSILEAMPSGCLKSTDEDEAAKQEAAATAKKAVFRTTMLYSATMPAAVERLSRAYLRRPAHIIIGSVGKTADRVEQRIEWVKSDADKQRRLVDLLYSGIQPPIMVFGNTKKTCDHIARTLNKLGFKCSVLHSGKAQDQREASMSSFREGRTEILVATDVAGRGIDVANVSHVINYDMPNNIEAYTHRIGRTGRAGKTGTAISYLMASDEDIMYDLKNLLVESNSPVPHELAQHPASKAPKGSVAAARRRDTVLHAK